MKNSKYQDEDQSRRHVITIRLRDDEHQAISDVAWRNRMSMSGWLREQALPKLVQQGALTIKH